MSTYVHAYMVALFLEIQRKQHTLVKHRKRCFVASLTFLKIDLVSYPGNESVKKGQQL